MTRKISEARASKLLREMDKRAPNSIERIDLKSEFERRKMREIAGLYICGPCEEARHDNCDKVNCFCECHKNPAALCRHCNSSLHETFDCLMHIPHEKVSHFDKTTWCSCGWVGEDFNSHLAAAQLGKIKSPEKSAASRKNGKLGGRPKKVLTR